MTGSVLKRLLTPSLADLLFFALLIWIFAAGNVGWEGLLADGDTGWHIRTGEYILDHGRVPDQDLYSFSRPGAEWFAWEWLAEVAFALSWRAAGLKGVVLLAATLVLAAALITFRRAVWLGADVFTAMAATLLAAGASSMHHLARPHVFTLFLLAVSAALLDADRRRPDRRVWLLAPLTALWANLHGGFAALIACLVLLAAGSGLEWRLGGGGREAHRRLARYSLLAAACAAASLVNPYGWRLHAHILDYLSSGWIRSAIQEFQSPDFQSADVALFEVLLVGGLVAVAGLVRRAMPGEALITAAWAHLALQSVRHVPVFATLTAPWTAAEASRLWTAYAGSRPAGSIASVLARVAEDLRPAFARNSLWPAAGVAGLMLAGLPMGWPSDFPGSKFPVELAGRQAGVLAGARVLTTDQWGDYLIYRFYPRQRVFIDGRSDFYGADLGREYLRMAQGGRDWEELLRRHGIEVVLAPAGWPLAELLKVSSGWRLVEETPQASLFVRPEAGGGAEGTGRRDPKFTR